MIYISVEPVENEKDCVTALFEKSPVQHQQKLLDMFEIEDQSFGRLFAYYQRKGRQDNFMSLQNMRSGVVSAMDAANRRTEKAKNRGDNDKRSRQKSFGRKQGEKIHQMSLLCKVMTCGSQPLFNTSVY